MKALISLAITTSLLVGAAAVPTPVQQEGATASDHSELPVRNTRYTIYVNGNAIERCTRCAFGTYVAPNGDNLYLKNGALVKEEADGF